MNTTVETYFFQGNGRIPNSRLPVTVYRQAFGSPARDMESRLRSNGWAPSWHSPIGFFPKHHFHSQAHELIAVVCGEVRGLFGGHTGAEVTLRKGDCVVIPAGVGHFGVSITDDLFVTGAFPSGFGVLDFRQGREDEYAEMVETSRAVPIPQLDPFFGLDGPLPGLWKTADLGQEMPEWARPPAARSDPADKKPQNGEISMHKTPPDISVFNSLTEQSPTGYARPIEEFGEVEVSQDHVANLRRMLDMLIGKRRALAQDAMAYQMTFTGRCYDIAKLQPMIEALERAIQHEGKLG